VNSPEDVFGPALPAPLPPFRFGSALLPSRIVSPHDPYRLLLFDHLPFSFFLMFLLIDKQVWKPCLLLPACFEMAFSPSPPPHPKLFFLVFS